MKTASPEMSLTCGSVKRRSHYSDDIVRVAARDYDNDDTFTYFRITTVGLKRDKVDLAVWLPNREYTSLIEPN
jgi:hypothetical protein